MSQKVITGTLNLKLGRRVYSFWFPWAHGLWNKARFGVRNDENGHSTRLRSGATVLQYGIYTRQVKLVIPFIWYKTSWQQTDHPRNYTTNSMQGFKIDTSWCTHFALHFFHVFHAVRIIYHSERYCSESASSITPRKRLLLQARTCKNKASYL